MLFQTLDDKDECVGIYCDDQLYFDKDLFPSSLTQTWKYAPHLDEYPEIEYANLYLEGGELAKYLPEYLLDDWSKECDRLNSFVRSLAIAKVNRHENCAYDLLPTRFLKDYCRVKNEITHYILTQYSRPLRYKYYLAVCKMLTEVGNRMLRFDKHRLQTYLSDPKSRPLVQRAVGSPYLKYNQFGTITGRLTTQKNSFPLLTLRKDLRSIVTPTNDLFVELDFNGAEARVVLGLLAQEQPTVDIHDYHRDHVFGGSISRSTAKELFFAWLYGSRQAATSKEGKILETFYPKDRILDTYWDGKKIYTPYRKEITNVDEHHALNYIVQSTAAELTLLQALKINQFLRQSSGSFISCIIHDSIVLDMSTADMQFLEPIKKLMSSTKFGKFGVNISMGENLGDLQKKESYGYG